MLWGIFINMTDWMHPVSHDLISLTDLSETGRQACCQVIFFFFLTMEKHSHFPANIKHIEEVDRDYYLVIMLIFPFQFPPNRAKSFCSLWKS